MERLSQRVIEKPWGRRGIPARFGAPGDQQIGEIWYEPPPGETLDVLAKYLFTSERLSIQVHPDEATAHARGLAHGKDECWIVLDVEPGAEIGIGTTHAMTPDALLAAASDGSIVDLIDWRPARAGQFIYNPAGTVHALGAGLTLLEIQQSVDVTYRLFDYGRPRALHLAESRAVVAARPHHHPADAMIDGGASRVLVDGAYFGVAWCAGRPPDGLGLRRQVQLLPIDAPMMVDGERIEPGECGVVGGDLGRLCSDGAFVLAWVGEHSAGAERAAARSSIM